MKLKKKLADAHKLEATRAQKKFDDKCFTGLGEIFNKNSKWKSIAIVLDYSDYIETWHRLRSPTKALLMYAEVWST